jgi:hypothetical protein
VLAAARRHSRIVIALVVGVVVLVVARRLLAIGSGTGPASSPAEPGPAGPAPARAPVEPAVPADAPSPVEPATPVSSPPVAGDGAWVPPADDGTCPLTHPVKAKESSGIYHVEGGLSYARTSADRCYASPASAEADGYRAAKR